MSYRKYPEEEYPEQTPHPNYERDMISDLKDENMKLRNALSRILIECNMERGADGTKLYIINMIATEALRD